MKPSVASAGITCTRLPLPWRRFHANSSFSRFERLQNWTLSIAAEWAEIKLQASVTRLCHLHLKACLEYPPPPPPPPLQRSWRSRRRGAAWWLSCMACRYVNEIKNKRPARAETIIVTADSCPRDSCLPVALPSPPQFSGHRSSTSTRQKGELKFKGKLLF